MSLIRRSAASFPLIALVTAVAFPFAARVSAQPNRQPNRQPQQVPVEQLIRLEEVSSDMVRTPEFDYRVRGMSTRKDGRKEWLQVKVSYRTAKEWTDDITITFYAVLEGDEDDLPRGSETRNMFTGTVSYVNVPKGDHQATMYLDPDTAERYGDVIALAALVTIDGRSAGNPLMEPRAQRPWWEEQTPVAYPLLNRSETPWGLVEMDQHNTIKP